MYVFKFQKINRLLKKIKYVNKFYINIVLFFLLLATSQNATAMFEEEILPLTTPLHNAISYENVEQVKSLIAKNEDLTAPNKDLWTPIHVAAERRNPELHKIIFEALKESDSSNWYDALRAQNSAQNTPLHIAASKGNTVFFQEVCRQGIPQGTIKTVIDKDRNTLFHTASAAGQEETLRFLLEGCFQEDNVYYSNVKNAKDCSPFDISLENGNEILTNVFLELDDKKKLDIASVLDKAKDAQNTKVIIRLQIILQDNPGYAAAQYRLGEMHENGWGVSINVDEALKWYTLSAKQGYHRAQYKFGLMYESGRDIPKSEEESLKWYNLAASQGHTPARYRLAVRSKNPEGAPKKQLEGIQCNQEIDPQKPAPAKFSFGKKYENGYELPRDDVKPIKWVQKDSDHGLAVLPNHLEVQENGERTPKNKEEILTYHQDIVFQNYVPTNLSFGVKYENGYEPKNDTKSIRWYRSTVNQSYILAQHAFAWIYKIVIGQF